MISRSSHSTTEQVLELQGVNIDHMAFGRKIRAVEEISFKVALGERFVLMGRSGCGKTTLLKAVGGFIQPNQGNIILNGKLIKKPGPDRMIVWQDLDQLLPWKTVEENVAYPLVMNGFRKKEALMIANEWLERVGLGQSPKRYPHELSGGMKQRTAIARGFAAKPQLLLMDEPFSALDALTRHKLQ
ncbi:MAG: ATP-binding cassette domain-containing protein, partial [Caedimonadaceae bacterium]